jgi:hypothetical protein
MSGEHKQHVNDFRIDLGASHKHYKQTPRDAAIAEQGSLLARYMQHYLMPASCASGRPPLRSRLRRQAAVADGRYRTPLRASDASCCAAAGELLPAAASCSMWTPVQSTGREHA